MEWLEGIRIFFVSAEASGPDNFWYHYQSLIAGVLAVVAAIATVWFLRKQINLEQKRVRDEIRRKHRAQLAGMPFSFTEVMTYAERCWDICILRYSEWSEDDDYEDAAVRQDLPMLPFKALRNIQVAVETASEADANKLSELLAFAQVQHSRLTSLIGPSEELRRERNLVIHKQNFVYACKDALELYFRAAHGLRYARGHSSEIEQLPGFDAVEEFLFFVPPGADDDLREELQKIWGKHYSMDRGRQRKP